MRMRAALAVAALVIGAFTAANCQADQSEPTILAGGEPAPAIPKDYEVIASDAGFSGSSVAGWYWLAVGDAPPQWDEVRSQYAADWIDETRGDDALRLTKGACSMSYSLFEEASPSWEVESFIISVAHPGAPEAALERPNAVLIVRTCYD